VVTNPFELRRLARECKDAYLEPEPGADPAGRRYYLRAGVVLREMASLREVGVPMDVLLDLLKMAARWNRHPHYARPRVLAIWVVRSGHVPRV
jgi:hypothetical protein